MSISFGKSLVWNLSYVCAATPLSSMEISYYYMSRHNQKGMLIKD